MNKLLLAKRVITCDEKLVIDKMIGIKQMTKLLDIIMKSVKLNQTTKFQSFLEAMKESNDILLNEFAQKFEKSGKRIIS